MSRPLDNDRTRRHALGPGGSAAGPGPAVAFFVGYASLDWQNKIRAPG